MTTQNNLEKPTESQSPPFILARVFDAPRDLVFDAWTNSERLKNWWGPKGFTVNVDKNDLRIGGMHHYCLRTPDGMAMWGRWIYREIVKPEKLTVEISFSDEKGGITTHPFVPNWPRETVSTATFEDAGGKTKVTINWRPINASDIEQKTFDANHESMTMGWGGTFDQLGEYLKGAG